MVEAVTVVVETGFGVVVFRREAMTEEVREISDLGNRIAEGVIGVRRDDCAGRIAVMRHVAVVVVERHVDTAVDREIEKSTDASRALERTREVLAPRIPDDCIRSVRARDPLFDEVPIVIEIGGRRLGRCLADAARFRIVVVRHQQDAVRGDGL